MATSASASAKMPPMPTIDGHAELRVGRQPSDQLAVAANHRRDQHGDVTVVDRGPSPAARWRPPGPRSASARPSRTRPRSVLWAMWSPQSLATTGKPSSPAAAPPPSGSVARRSGSTGRPNAGQQGLRVGLGERAAARAHVGHGCVPYSAMQRGLIEGFYGPPWSWSARAEVMRWCHERGHDAVPLRPQGRSAPPRALARALPPEASWTASPGLVAEDTLRVGFAISPGLSIDTGIGRRPVRARRPRSTRCSRWAST